MGRLYRFDARFTAMEAIGPVPGAVVTLALLMAVLPGPAARGDEPVVAGGSVRETANAPSPKCANLGCADPMFTVFHPPRGRHVTGHGAEVTYPLAAYDARSTDLYGSTDLAAVEAITAGSGFHPVATHDGRGLAYVGVFEVHDSNLGRYRQIELDLLVNEQTVTVSTENPYAFISELLNPRHQQWVHKVIGNQWIPIDYGRELHGWDANPEPGRIEVRSTTDETTFSVADPAGNLVVSGHLVFDADPMAQAKATGQFGAAGSEWVKPFLTGGGLIQINFVNPDGRGLSAVPMRSHMLVRLESGPMLGVFGPESALKVDPNSDFGGALSHLDFRPVVAARADFRYVFDSGFAPPLLGWSGPSRAGGS